MEHLPNERLVLTPHAIKRHTRRLQQEIQELFKNEHIQDVSNFSLSQSQNMLARILGMKDYYEMHKVLSNEPTEIAVSNIDQVQQIINNIKIENSFTYNTAGNINNILLQLSSIEDVNHINIQSDTPIYIDMEYKRYLIDKNRVINYAEVEHIITHLYNSDGALHLLNGGHDLDFPYQINIDRDKKLRFRINVTSILSDGKRGYSITIKKLGNRITDIHKIVINPQLIASLNVNRGIVISGGYSNSKKELLLHSFLQYKLNREDKVMCVYEFISEHIYSLQNELSSISYVEVYKNLIDMQNAIRNAQRRSLDIAFFSEIRTGEEIKEMINTSQCGQIIYTTLNSNSIADTICRLYLSVNKNEIDFTNLLNEISCITQQYAIYQQNKKPVYIQSYLTLTNNIRDQLTDLIYKQDFNSGILRKFINSMIKDHGFSTEQALNIAFKKNLINLETYTKNQHLIE